ncbi:unnamed protein product [Adineta steineri]|uniref:Uncharacterized protein n=2 Tax=Adineta steineri TaxID=433720 RepID=A0A819K8D1_9BILA|nr:unnamed protein product [Adineta steineri]
MKFQFGHQVVLPSVPIDVAFKRLTSAAYVERVVRLSDLASDFQLISNKGNVIRYQFVENISLIGGLIKKRVPIIVKQTIDRHNMTLLYESDGNKGKILITKWRIFTPIETGDTTHKIKACKMKFDFGHEIVLPSVPIDVAFERLTSASYVEQVVRLSDLADEFELISNEGDVIRYQFVENISMMGGLIKKRLPIIVKQTRDRNKMTLLYESDVDKGTVTIIKCRSFTPTEDGGTLVSETVDGECPMLYQPITKRQGHNALIEGMNKYPTLFKEFYI